MIVKALCKDAMESQNPLKFVALAVDMGRKTRDFHAAAVNAAFEALIPEEFNVSHSISLAREELFSSPVKQKSGDKSKAASGSTPPAPSSAKEST